MRYIDDVLYLLGWLCLIVCAFSFGWRLGMVVLAAAFWVTAIIWAKASAKFAKKSRDEPKSRRNVL